MAASEEVYTESYPNRVAEVEAVLRMSALEAHRCVMALTAERDRLQGMVKHRDKMIQELRQQLSPSCSPTQDEDPETCARMDPVQEANDAKIERLRQDLYHLLGRL